MRDGRRNLAGRRCRERAGGCRAALETHAWDGQWYRVIAEEGYPRVLPRVGHGGIDMNPWAFFPVFPLTAGAIMTVTGLPFVVVGPVLSTLIGFAAMFLLFKLVDEAVATLAGARDITPGVRLADRATPASRLAAAEVDAICDVRTERVITNHVFVPVVLRPLVSAASKKIPTPLSGWDNTFWNLRDWWRDA